MSQTKREIGLAIVGCGTIGRIRAMIARAYPGVVWLGLCDIKEHLAKKLAEDAHADFVTTDFRELINRPEVTAVIIATDENCHFEPTMAAIERGVDLFIEKPLATDVRQSATVLKAVEASGIDACMGYTNRFRRRFLTIKERIAEGRIGDVSCMVTRAFMNRMIPLATVRRTSDHTHLTPMIVSGTHSFDLSMWLMGNKKPISVYAQASDKVLGIHGTKDSTFGVFTMEDGSIFSMNISWALPETWPGAVYGIEMGIVGTKGVIDVDDTHRDLVLASLEPQGASYKPDGFSPEGARYVDFLTSYPPGDICEGQLWGPIREETNSWLAHLYTGMKTPHATVQDGHRNLLLTMAMDISCIRKQPLQLPLDLDEYYKDF